MSTLAARPLFETALVKRALIDSFVKLSPHQQWRNPVMFVVFIGSLLTTGLFFQALAGSGEAPAGFILAIALWLWFTLLFANFAEAIAEGRGKAQAQSLRGTRRDLMANKLDAPHATAKSSIVPASALRKGDAVMVRAGDVIPNDGEVIEGVASVDESAITGESAPVIRESGGDFSSVTGGTRVLSDWIVVRIGANPGEAFIDRMIAMVEGAKRQKTPNEIALSILLAALTLIFLKTTATLLPFSIFSVGAAGQGTPITITVLVALLIYYEMMDDTQTSSATIAVEKGKTAAMFRRPSKAFEDGIAAGRVAILGLPGATPIDGGLPIVVNGKIIGGIGVSGVNSDQDAQIARAGLDALK